MSLGRFWFEKYKVELQRYSREYSLAKICWGFVEFVTDWISSWVFHMGNQSAQRDFLPLLVNEQYLWYDAILCWTLWRYSLYCCSLSKRGSEVRFNRMSETGRGLELAQGHFREPAIHWHECFHPASRMLKDILSVYPVAQGLELLCLTSSAEPTRACYSVYRQCSF